MTEIIEHLKKENTYLNQHLQEMSSQVQNLQNFIQQSRAELNSHSLNF